MYCAPGFSITNKNALMLRVLAEEGIDTIFQFTQGTLVFSQQGIAPPLSSMTLMSH